MAKLRSWQKTPAPEPRAGEQEWLKRGMTKHGGFSVAVTQIASYAVLLFAVFTLGTHTASGLIGLGFLLLSGSMVMLVGWPFEGEARESVFARVLASVTFLVGFGYLASGEFYTDRTFLRWAGFLVIWFWVMVFVSFLRQMMRRNRSHLIRSLSVGLMASLSTLGAVCWMFLPSLVRDLNAEQTPTSLAVTVIVVLLAAAVALLAASITWWNGKPRKLPFSWMGMGMVPVLMLGYGIFVAAFAIHFGPAVF
ncbi:hypothetical protein [Bifidobacterium simiarum]|uniref:hypothetical protein n=1 Tax=Bifidobacterium simiarum TaxID=2045441 RepID=UPI001BDD2CB5|nr:hypothetical protein [Bifidobacterium simiarum]MBT1167114.1 hypothetical protein [Bifidobacterium simiarum]